MARTPNIQIACMSLMWGFETTDTMLTKWWHEVVEAGYEGVATFSKMLAPFCGELSLAQRLSDLGLELASVDWEVSRDYESLRRVCELMQSMNCCHLVCLGGLASPQADVREVAEVLDQIGQISLEYGIRAGFHNHTNTTGETMEEAEMLLGMTNRKKFFGFVDVGHATKDFVGYPVEKRATIFLERNWDRIDFLEFKDWSREYDLCTDVGAGLCDYDSVFTILKQKDYSGWITVEQNGPMGEKTTLQCAIASREFIKKGLGV